MSPRFLHRLRRCRALWVLALCAWLAMGSAAWTKSDCCASMGMHGMTSMHADHQNPSPHQHAIGHCDCACMHAAIDRLALAVNAAEVSLLDPVYAQALSQNAPQPVYAPPPRPPSV